MKVCIDAIPLDTVDRFRGIGSYVEGLLKGFRQYQHHLFLVQLRLLRKCAHEINMPVEAVFIKRPSWLIVRFQWLFNELFLSAEISKTKADIFHATNPIVIAKGRNFKTVATAYDFY